MHIVGGRKLCIDDKYYGTESNLEFTLCEMLVTPEPKRNCAGHVAKL